MKDELSQEQIDDIVKCLDDLLHKEIWNDSNFLRVIAKNIAKIREEFIDNLNQRKSEQESKTEANLVNRVALRNGQLEIFISLYSSDGRSLQSWERILLNLPKQLISRPIYSDEEHVKAIIRSKDNKQNEAYVAIYVNQSDVLQLDEDKIPKDKLGKKLLTLKDRSLNLENVIRFVHDSHLYHYMRGRLIRFYEDF